MSGVILKGRKIERCPMCGYDKFYLDEERGELVCMRCGYVIEESMIDYGREWRIFEDESSSRELIRAGKPVSYSKVDLGLTTSFGRGSDFSKLSPEDREKFAELQRWQQILTSSSERNLKHAIRELNRLASIFNLSEVIKEEASKLYRQAVEKNLVRGRSVENVVAACIYIASRIHGLPLTLNEIAEVSGLSKKEIGKTFRYLYKQLRLKVPPATARDYIYKFGNQLGLSQKTISKALELLSEAEKQGLTSGKGPTGVAAACLYIASLLTGEKKTQGQVAEVARVTEVTIRNRYKELVSKLGLEEKLRRLESLE